jgi:hypothetical protein
MKLLEHLEYPFCEETEDYRLTCLWCSAEDKLSMSKEEGNVFQCWRCKQTGNAISFMRQWFEDLPALTPEQARIYTSVKKGVQPRTLKDEGIKFDGTYFWFPVMNQKGHIIALHKYSLEASIAYASPKPWNCSILGMQHLTKSEEVWVAEGHADYLIGRQMLKGVNDAPDLLGTAGSGFASSWLHLLDGKSVVLLFDNDDAGHQGVLSVARRIKQSGHAVNSLHALDWSQVTVPSHSEIPSGFDLRDWYNSVSA